jgi:hypothetical protein
MFVKKWCHHAGQVETRASPDSLAPKNLLPADKEIASEKIAIKECVL